MGLFDFLFRSKNPTRDWVRPPGLRLTFDLDSSTLNGVGFGEPLASVSFLGPAEDRRNLHYGEYGYYSLGLVVESHNEQNTLDSFDLVNKDPNFPRYESFGGDCLFRGSSLKLSRLTQAFLHEQLGQPFSKDEDDDEVILFYEFPNLEWQVEFAPDGTLNRIVITNRILLADEEQRAAYGVTKPWPPTYQRPQ
jgi:hypothetical protein